jgi:hypothetical protein
MPYLKFPLNIIQNEKINKKSRVFMVVLISILYFNIKKIVINRLDTSIQDKNITYDILKFPLFTIMKNRYSYL